MARPRKSNEERSARQRILDAFWELIEQAPLEKITVIQIVDAARINRNTFYYHFDNIADLANKALIENIPKKALKSTLLKALDSGFDTSRFEPPGDIEVRYHRTRLLLTNGDSETRRTLEKKCRRLWAEISGVEVDSLDPGSQSKIDFVCGGITALITSKKTPTFNDYLAEMSDGIGEAIFSLMKKSSFPETEMTR